MAILYSYIHSGAEQIVFMTNDDYPIYRSQPIVELPAHIFRMDDGDGTAILRLLVMLKHIKAIETEAPEIIGLEYEIKEIDGFKMSLFTINDAYVAIATVIK